MAAVIQGQSSGTGTASVDIETPTGALDGELLIAVVASFNHPNNIVPQQIGWTEIGGQGAVTATGLLGTMYHSPDTAGKEVYWDTGPDEGHLSVFFRRSLGESTTYTFVANSSVSLGESLDLIGVMFRVGGGEGFYAVDTYVDDDLQGDGLTVDIPALTYTQTVLGFAAVGWYTNAATLTLPSAWTEVFQGSNNDIALAVGTAALAGDGTQAATTGTFSASTSSGSRVFSIVASTGGDLQDTVLTMNQALAFEQTLEQELAVACTLEQQVDFTLDLE